MKKNLHLKQSNLWMKGLVLIALLAFSAIASFGQNHTITGTVTDESNSPLPGVTILVKGTTTGSITDLNGNYSLAASAKDSLQFSFVGYTTETILIGAQTVINVKLLPNLEELQEVVVIGYGTTKVKDLTSSITTVKSDDLVKTPSSQPMQALQGKVAGLQVVSNGSPGGSSTVRVRGLGSYPSSDLSTQQPLYVVDGMFFDNIDFISPSDIASISVLKDASALAIFGVKAANGVVLIETKSGKYDQPTSVSYEGYTGYQIAQNVLKMANAQQFVTMVNESGTVDTNFVLNAMQRYGRSRVDPNIPDVNTDWYKEILRPAVIQNHSVNIDGGTSKAKYSIGTNYFAQDGILDMKNSYQRFNLRAKVDIKAKDWLTVGGNVIFSDALKYSEQKSAWNLAYFAIPILPVYDDQNVDAWPDKYANAQDLGYRAGQNPFPTLKYNEDKMNINKFLADFYAEFTLIPKTLTFKTTYNHSYTSLDQRVVNLPYFIGNSFQNPDSKVTKTFSIYSYKIWDNLLTYTKEFNKHNISMMIGSEYQDDGFQKLKAQGIGFPTNYEQSWYINQSATVPSEEVEDDGYRQYGLSYFGRLAYNFDNRYLLYATYRADGSSKYQEKWGYFPTIGAGWVLSEEGFLKNNDIVSYLKLRGSWGKLGNNYVAAQTGTFTSTVVTTAINGVVYSGTIANSTFGYLKWEVNEETNVGLTSRFLQDRMSADIDYFRRNTINAVIPVSVPGTRDIIVKNAGKIRNSGIELALNWTDKPTDKLSYTVGVNLSTLKNEIVDLYGQSYIDAGQAEFDQRNMVGEPLMSFFGLEVDGVYQNQAEIDADPTTAGNGLVPGDFKYKDQNGDGVINGDDRVVLGSYLPKFSYGANLGITYGSWEFTANFYGQTGNKILNRKRGEVIWTSDQNMDADLAKNRWHGEGTSNEYPSAAGLRKGWNQKMSTYFVEDGSFFRIQNVQLAYNIKDLKIMEVNFPETKVFLTADRPLTVFKYHGFSPEIADGIDTQTYPVPATYTIGLNVKF